MKTKFLYVFAAILFAGFTVKAQSELNIGYTNVDYILSLLPEAKEIEAELNAYTKQLESQLEYFKRGNYGFYDINEMITADVPMEIAEQMMKIKQYFAFGKIRDSRELVDAIPFRGRVGGRR